LLEQLVTERKAMDKLLGEAARKDKVCLRLMTILGVGPITSLAFRVTVDDPARFDSLKTVGAHVGLTPRIYQSGEIERSGRISKMLRHLLYDAASALMNRCRQPAKLRAWGVAVARRRGAKRARVATQARGDHAPHVGLRKHVRDRNGEAEDACRAVGGGFSPILHNRDLDDGIGQSDMPPVNVPRSGSRAVRLDGRTLVSNPGAAAMPDPEQKRDPGCGLEARGRCASRFRDAGSRHSLAIFYSRDWVWKVSAGEHLTALLW
jgi:hypothetical protein